GGPCRAAPHREYDRHPVGRGDGGAGQAGTAGPRSVPGGVAMNRATVAAALGMALSMAAGGHATAQVTLRVADSLPATHFFTEPATRFWWDAVAQLAGPEVTFEHFPAGQLGKAGDLFSLTASGVVDIGYVVPSYAAEKLPLTSVAELPGTFE